jgi:heat shock protein HslJ
VAKLPHTILRPIHALSVVVLLIGASVAGSTVSATTSVAQDQVSAPPSAGSDAVQNGGTRSNERTIALQPSELEGAWRLDSYSHNGFLTPVADGTLITAEFDRGTISGHASCNDYTGPYLAGEYTIHIGPVAMTRMACERDVMEQEHAYLDALESAATWSVQATTLTLAQEGGLPVAIFGRSLLSTGAPTSNGL